jgi:hypothetical protein
MKNILIILTLFIAISFSMFVYVPSNLGYKVFLTPPATSIKNLKLQNSYLNITTNSTTTKIKYSSISSLINFLRDMYPLPNKKVLIKIQADREVEFMGKKFKSQQFLIDSNWYYCSYENLFYIFPTYQSTTIRIKIPKYNLQIISNTNSKVYLLNNFLGLTPLSTMLYAGEYNVKIDPISKKYKSKTVRIELKRDYSLSVSLEKLNFVNIKTNVNNYTIYINGRKQTNSLYLDDGKYLLTIEATGFYRIEKTIVIDSNANLYFKLKPKIFKLKINSLNKSKIYVDSIFLGYGNTNISLQAGKHTIEIFLNGYKSIKKVIDLEKDESLNIELQPLPGTIVDSFNIQNCLFATYVNNTLTVITKDNIFKIGKKIDAEKNDGYFYIYERFLIDLSGKIKYGDRVYTVRPFITSIIKVKNFYVISTSSGYIYKFNGLNQPILIKGLSINYPYIKIANYKDKILALAGNGHIYLLNIQTGSMDNFIDEKYLKDFYVNKDEIYAVTQNEILVYRGNRKIKEIQGEYHKIYKNFAYGKYVFDISKNKIVGENSLNSLNSEIYYNNGYIYYPTGNEVIKYKINCVPKKIIKFGGYIVIIEKDKVEVMKL